MLTKVNKKITSFWVFQALKKAFMCHYWTEANDIMSLLYAGHESDYAFGCQWLYGVVYRF